MKWFTLTLALVVIFTLDAVELLNVSYDPTREFYNEYNAYFENYWKEKTGEEVEIKQSHGGSGKQARAVMDGLDADVVTLALAYDIDAIARKGFIKRDWKNRLPFDSAPSTSVVVFLVRKGNPKNIRDFDDLVKEGVSVITPNPKTSGGARWNYLAVWAYAMKKWGDESKAKEFMGKFFKHVPILDTGARGASMTFVQRNIGDVLVTWESDANLAKEKANNKGFEIVIPPLTILAEPPVAVVDTVVEKKGTRVVAEAYLKELYSKEAQKLAAKNYYRPRDEAVAKEFSDLFPKVKTVTIEELGGWENVQKVHFDDGGIFDQVYLDAATKKD